MQKGAKRLRIFSVTGTLLAAAAVAIMAAGCGDSGDEQANCSTEDPLFKAFQPPGGDRGAYTMGIRVNKADEVSDIESELGDRIEERDVFVINTQYEGSSPDDWKDALDEIKDKFPCNRVAVLNGLHDDSSRPGYMRALVGESELDAVLLDWEPDTYNGTGEGSWSSSLDTNLRRIRERMNDLAGDLKDQKTRMGIVPDYLAAWNYGSIQRELALANFALEPGHHGYQVVQTQPYCGVGGGTGAQFDAAADAIRAQYRPLYGFAATNRGWENVAGDSNLIGRHLAFEVAFSTSPSPNAGEAVERVGPEEAARCTDKIVTDGDGAILYWAAPADLKAMLDTEVGKRLRPSGS
jgi:hypothetical protein